MFFSYQRNKKLSNEAAAAAAAGSVERSEESVPADDIAMQSKPFQRSV